MKKREIIEFDEVVRIIYFEDGSKLSIHICDVEAAPNEPARRIKYFLDQDIDGKKESLKAIGATGVRHHIIEHRRTIYRSLEDFRKDKDI